MHTATLLQRQSHPFIRAILVWDSQKIGSPGENESFKPKIFMILGKRTGNYSRIYLISRARKKQHFKSLEANPKI